MTHRERFHRSRAPLVATLVVLCASPALAAPQDSDGPILHEYVPYDPSTDSDLGAVTIEGGFAAEVMTHSGRITAPDVARPITGKTPIYSSKTPVPDEAFVPDRDTRRIDNLPYDDPFRPSLAPFKRLVALDAVEADYKLRLRDRSRREVDVTKEISPREPTDPFYLSLALELRAGEAIRIPNVIAGTIVKKAYLSPKIDFRIERDGAENLFIVGLGSGPARLVIELLAPRDAFAGETRAFAFSELPTALLPVLPPNVQRAADIVARELHIDKTTMLPHEALRVLVRYFREFKESDDPPPTSGDIYLDIVRSKKGVCRHRAFAMMVTAIGLGIPARFVYNEAHAWVEVHDGYLFRRIDLGGAGRVLDDKSERQETPQPHFEPPTDPFPWPTGATQGSDLIPPTHPGASTGPTTGTGTTGTLGMAPTPTPSPSPTSVTASAAPPSKVSLILPTGTPSVSSNIVYEIERTHSLSVKGHLAASDGSACKRVRVELVFHGAAGIERIASVLASDDDGNYDGTVTVPSDLALGDYTVTAHTPGGGACGQGTSD
ncbi:MAG: hypothetical protein NVSMB1_10290 [Polyangiales bacterium]